MNVSANNLNVRNISKKKLAGSERDFIRNEVAIYLARRNDCPFVVISEISDGWYEQEAIRPVREGYTVDEVVNDLGQELIFDGYTNQVWYVCQLSKSLKTITVLEVIRAN